MNYCQAIYQGMFPCILEKQHGGRHVCQTGPDEGISWTDDMKDAVPDPDDVYVELVVK